MSNISPFQFEKSRLSRSWWHNFQIPHSITTPSTISRNLKRLVSVTAPLLQMKSRSLSTSIYSNGRQLTCYSIRWLTLLSTTKKREKNCLLLNKFRINDSLFRLFIHGAMNIERLERERNLHKRRRVSAWKLLGVPSFLGGKMSFTTLPIPVALLLQRRDCGLKLLRYGKAESTMLWSGHYVAFVRALFCYSWTRSSFHC